MINEFKDEYFFLSNFYNTHVTYNGVTYLNSEAAFQAQKCSSQDQKVLFADMNPSDAKKYGRRVKLRADWDAIKFKTMEEIVRAKFEQNPDLRQKLIATGDCHLEEGNTWGDKIWGTVDGVGENNLGKILMRVRDELR